MTFKNLDLGKLWKILFLCWNMLNFASKCVPNRSIWARTSFLSVFDPYIIMHNSDLSEYKIKSNDELINMLRNSEYFFTTKFFFLLSYAMFCRYYLFQINASSSQQHSNSSHGSIKSCESKVHVPIFIRKAYMNIF